MLGHEQKDFGEQMGFAQAPHRPPSDGVVADWSQLPAESKQWRHAWTQLGSKTESLTSDAARASWVYEGKTQKASRLTIAITVCGGGQAAAIARMNEVGHSSNMAMNPFGPAPAPMTLGDFTAVSFPERAARLGRTLTIFWVYRNVLAEVRVTGTEGEEVFPIARVIQHYMNHHQVKDLPLHLPKVQSLRFSPVKAVVGQLLHVEAVVGALSPSLKIQINCLTDHLKFDTEDRTTATYFPQAAGTAVIEAVILDEKTLLTTRRQEPIQVAADR